MKVTKTDIETIKAEKQRRRFNYSEKNTQVVTDKKSLEAVENCLWDEIFSMEKEVDKLQKTIAVKKELIMGILNKGIYIVEY